MEEVTEWESIGPLLSNVPGEWVKKRPEASFFSEFKKKEKEKKMYSAFPPSDTMALVHIPDAPLFKR